MYSLHEKLTAVDGIGDAVAAKLASHNLITIKDLLLWVPLRYEDRSQQKLIKDLVKDELVTVQAEVTAISNQYKGRRSIQRATIRDESESLKLIWFNAPFIARTLIKGHVYFFSGKLNKYGQMSQPKVEKVSDNTIHTNRLVPVYSQLADLKIGNLRRYLKNITDQLGPIPDTLAEKFNLLPLTQTFQHLHFPASQELTIKARERLAVEELLSLMKRSQEIKNAWAKNQQSISIAIPKNYVPKLPFTLTSAQQRSLEEILSDLKKTTPMNRLLLGDVGSGKTVVAGIAALHALHAQHHVALIAPTQILAEQHTQTLTSLFPQLKIQLLTAKTKFTLQKQPYLYVGTHAVINKLTQIQPALVIYDEQHRFGVKQRSEVTRLQIRPHVLTMTATPIPRSLMLTIFSHLNLSVIDEMPAGRLPIKTWLVPEKKRSAAYLWMRNQLQKSRGQALVVCPFIDPSLTPAFKNIKAANTTFTQIKQHFPHLRVGLLHGRLSQAQKDKIITQLFAKQIDILVTTPIIEVGIDLPKADIIVIESAERFGLASLHQLRGRVGRGQQQAYCLLFPSLDQNKTKNRLQYFAATNDGLKLAEYDLQSRGAGDLFGTEQHGFDQLQFASWANTKLVAQARQIFEHLANTAWSSVLSTTSHHHQSPQKKIVNN